MFPIRSTALQSPVLRTVLRALGWLFLLALIVRLYQYAFRSSDDFSVYWKAIRLWLSGQSPYLIRPEDLGFVFKYPPWLIPIFAPLNWIPWPAAQALWATLQIAIIGYSVHRLISLGLDRRVVWGVTLAYWWLWLMHVYAGQITIFLLGAALWVHGSTDRQSGRWAFLGVVFSAKIFSLITLAGVLRRCTRGPVLLRAGLYLLVTHLALFFVAWGFGLTSPGQAAGWLADLYGQWARAASSGGTELSFESIRGHGNHGFTAAILRWLRVGPKNTAADLGVFLGTAIFFSVLWHRFSKRLPELDRWLGWLALGCIVHPLAWQHTFLLAYPFSAVSLDRSIKDGRPGVIALSALGLAMVALLIPQVITPELARPLEMMGEKSWGTVLSAVALLISSGDSRC